MFCTIALLSPPYGDFTYSIPPYIPLSSLKKGLRVAIPFGNGQLRLGIIIEIKEEHDLKEKINIKPIVWTLEKDTLLSAEIIQLVEELSTRQAQTCAQIYANMLPQALRSMQRLVLCEYQEGKRPYNHTFKEIKNYSLEQCTQLYNDFLNTDKVELRQIAQNNASYEVCKLLKDPPWNIRPSAHKQKELLEYLFNNGDTSRNFLQKTFGNTLLATINSLAKNGIIGIFPQESEDSEEEENKRLLALLESTLLLDSKPIFEFSSAQNKAIEQGKNALDNNKFEVRLVHGITGSGKTALYLELARLSLLQNKSVFLLAPEVALALKLKKDVLNALPQVKTYVSHGYQSPLQRAKLYENIAKEEEPCIMIGTRSALFHSLHTKQKIGFIALDEEHDASYKQDEKFYYHAKEIALFRAKKHNALLLLGSATPDIKSFYSAKNEQISLDTLAARVGGGSLPNIELVDIADNKNSELLSARSLELLKECIEKDEQAVILLNRRGYSPIVYCLDCKQVQRCPHCSIALAYHKKREVLTCHYCNYSKPFPSACTECKGLAFLPLGDGTEKLEEQLAAFLNTLATNEEKKILRLDRDSTRRQGSMEDILARFSRKEAHILIGTQMLSKGHHFPHVSLAIIADADLSLNFPDYRAAERTFQLLIQSAGRAGREIQNGKVVIQTRDTKHYCWQFIEKQDYLSFYEHELALRQKRFYPPFTKLALLRIYYPFNMEDYSLARTKLTKYLKMAAKEFNVQLLGPVESPIARINNINRYQCLIKADDWAKIRSLYISAKTMQGQEKALKDVQLILDLDPVNML